MLEHSKNTPGSATDYRIVTSAYMESALLRVGLGGSDMGSLVSSSSLSSVESLCSMSTMDTEGSSTSLVHMPHNLSQ